MKIVQEYLEMADCNETLFLATFLVSYLVSSRANPMITSHGNLRAQ